MTEEGMCVCVCARARTCACVHMHMRMHMQTIFGVYWPLCNAIVKNVWSLSTLPWQYHHEFWGRRTLVFCNIILVFCFAADTLMGVFQAFSSVKSRNLSMRRLDRPSHNETFPVPLNSAAVCSSLSLCMLSLVLCVRREYKWLDLHCFLSQKLWHWLQNQTKTK
jgi:hypothetical protein